MCTLFEKHAPFHYPYQNLSCYQYSGKSVCSDEMFNDFWSVNISSLLNFAWWLAIWAEYFPPCSKLSRDVCKVDLKNSCFLPKLIMHVHSEISWCSWFQIPRLCVWLVEKSCHIYFCQQKSFLHNIIAIYQCILFHVLGIQQSIFCCVHQYWHAKYSW